MTAAEKRALAYPAFWDAARDGCLQLQRCNGCGTLRYFPAPVCPACLSTESAWEAVSGLGTVHAFTIVHRAPNAMMAKKTPYTIALIDLDENVRVMARLEDAPAEGPRIGTPVRFAGVGDSGLGPWLLFKCRDVDRRE